MNTLGLMRRVQLKSITRALSGKGGGRIAQFVFGALAVLILTLAIFFGSLAIFRGISGAPNGKEFVASFLSGIYGAAAVLLIFTGITRALYGMYLSRDLDVLLSMPIKERTVFAYKFWEVFASNGAMFAFLGLPALVAYGVATGSSVLFYPVMLLVSVMVVMVPTGLCVLLIMPLMRLVPPGKAKEIVAALGALAGIIIWVVFYLFNPPGSGAAFSPSGGISNSRVLHAPPGSWASEAVTGAATLDWERLFGGLWPLALLAFGLYAVCLALAGWAYATGRARAAESSGKVRSSGGIGVLFGWLPRDARAVAVKDLTCLPRDYRRLAGLVMPLALGTFYATFNSVSGSEGGGAGLFSIVPYLVAAGISATGPSWGEALQTIGGEGRSYGILAASPMSPGRVLLGKWIGGTTVGSVLAILASAIVSLLPGFFYLPGLLLGLIGGPAIAAAVSAYGVGISAMFPRFDWDNPNRATTFEGNILTTLCFLGLLVLSGVCFAGWYFLGNVISSWISAALIIPVWLLVAGIPAYAVASMGARRLELMEWEL